MEPHDLVPGSVWWMPYNPGPGGELVRIHELDRRAARVRVSAVRTDGGRTSNCWWDCSWILIHQPVCRTETDWLIATLVGTVEAP